MNNDSRLPDYYLSTHRMLECAFPRGVESGDYLSLLTVLNTKMSIRSIARVISVFTDKDYHDVYHDVLRAQSADTPDLGDVMRIKQHLIGCGYMLWLDED
jgi:hypothetical protein